MMLESKNMQYAFQVEYPNKALKSNDASAMNKDLVNLLTQDLLKEAFDFSNARAKSIESKDTYTLRMRVLYPGLLMGTGYPHATKHPTGEIQMGFSFDYVTGLPYYPGSSLKGVLRNPFKLALADNEAAEEYLDYLRDVFHKPGFTASEVRTFVNQTFKGCEEDEMEGLPMQIRDVFYDSYPIGFDSNGAPSHLMKLDHLAPHLELDTKKPNPLKNPIPLTMLRVMPNTCFAFQMKLHDVIGSDGEILFTAEEKLKAFKTILLDFGIGAKTHVGYGNLEEVDGDISTQLKKGEAVNSKGEVSHGTAPKGPQIPKDAGEAPICKSCNKNKAAYNFNTKSWGNFCENCLKEKRKNRNSTGKKDKSKPQAKVEEEPADENTRKLQMLKKNLPEA